MAKFVQSRFKIPFLISDCDILSNVNWLSLLFSLIALLVFFISPKHWVLKLIHINRQILRDIQSRYFVWKEVIYGEHNIIIFTQYQTIFNQCDFRKSWTLIWKMVFYKALKRFIINNLMIKNVAVVSLCLSNKRKTILSL